MALIPKSIYMFNAIPIKIPMTFMTKIENSTLSSFGNTKGHQQLSQAKRAMLEVSQYPTSNYTTEPAINTAWYWHKNRYEDQWNRIEDLDMNPRSFAHLIFYKVAKNIRWRKYSLFNKFC
jgi:hypothetical protein